jgi:hypothetical protein
MVSVVMMISFGVKSDGWWFMNSVAALGLGTALGMASTDIGVW